MIVMNLRWAGITPDQYDKARDAVGWEADPPTGGRFHIAWFADDALHAVDVWDSAEAFQVFADTRLIPVTKGELGLPGEPDVSINPLHRCWDAVHLTAHG